MPRLSSNNYIKLTIMLKNAQSQSWSKYGGFFKTRDILTIPTLLVMRVVKCKTTGGWCCTGHRRLILHGTQEVGAARDTGG